MSTPPSGVIELPPGTDPALSYARPDIELRALHAVRPLGGAITWCYAAAEGDPPGWLFRATIQVDVRAHNRAAAAQRADAARRAICALPWADWPEGVINRVDVVDGPFWLPDENNAPRYVARYAITFHPRPAWHPEGETE